MRALELVPCSLLCGVFFTFDDDERQEILKAQNSVVFRSMLLYDQLTGYLVICYSTVGYMVTWRSVTLPVTRQSVTRQLGGQLLGNLVVSYCVVNCSVSWQSLT